MPAVNYDLMLQEMLTKTPGKVNQVIYWGGPLDWHNQMLTPKPDTPYFVMAGGMSRCAAHILRENEMVFPRAGRNCVAMNGARSKVRYTGILQIPLECRNGQNTREFCIRLTTKNYSFDFTPFHRFPPRWKFPSETDGK
jgi:hypothetical protein